MRKMLILFSLVCVITGSLPAKETDDFHLRVATPTEAITPVVSSSSSGVSDGKFDQVEELVSSTSTRLVNQVLDLIASIDWSDWLDRILPDKFKEILADAGLWPIEGTALDLDVKEMTDMGKEVMDKISTLE